MTSIRGYVRGLVNRMLSPVLWAVRDLQPQLAQLQDKQELLARELHALRTKMENTGTFRLSELEVMTKIFTGAKMYLDPRDVALVPHLILDGDWERDITHAWLTSLRDNDVVMDIGANFGYFSVLAAQQTNRSAKVILFEANPGIIPYLTKTMDVNSFDGCSVIENVAVSDKKGKASLRVLKDYLSSSSLHVLDKINEFNKNKQEVSMTVEVPTVTIDDYCKQHNINEVNMIKMDIEGFEEKAYQGMRQTVKSSKDITLFLEFTKDAYDDPKAFYKQMLEDFGHVYLIDQQGNIFEPSSSKYEDVILSADNWTMPIFSKSRKLVQR